MSISGIFTLLVLASMVFLAIKLFPPYYSNYLLQTTIESIAMTSTYSPMGEEDIAKTVIKRANEYGIVLQTKQVTVHKGNGSVAIVADYTVPVDLMVRQLDLHFEPSTSNTNIAK